MIKTNFVLGEEVNVFNWFKILFIENEGMAWGTEIPGTYGKLFLTVFRLIAVTAIGYWLWDASHKNSSNYLIVAIALILAGAFGNIIQADVKLFCFKKKYTVYGLLIVFVDLQFLII